MNDTGRPAIERMTPDERAIFVRFLADIALDQALKELEADRTAAQVSIDCSADGESSIQRAQRTGAVAVRRDETIRATLTATLTTS